MKALILGGSGFVGRRLAEILASQAAVDPLWGRTFDFAYEAKIAAALRGHWR